MEYSVTNDTISPIRVVDNTTKTYETIDVTKTKTLNISSYQGYSIVGTELANGMVYQKNFPDKSDPTTITISTNTAPPSLLQKNKRLISPIFVLIFGIVLVVLGIIVFPLIAHKKALDQKKYFLKSGDTGEEFAQMEAVGQIHTPSYNGYVAFGIIAILIGICLSVLWIFIGGPKSWLSYKDCKAKRNFGQFWFWTKPTSTFRKVLCTLFGACECSSYVLQSQCEVSQKQWDISAVRVKRTPGNCFCCNEGKECTDPSNDTATVCKQ